VVQARLERRKRLWPAGLLGGLAAWLALLPAAAPAQEREQYDIELFSRVADSPEGIAVDSAGTVYVGTDPRDGGPAGERKGSRVYAYDGEGNLLREYPIEGQNLDDPQYGLLGLAFDGRDRLYGADSNPPRIIRLNTRTGAQSTYAKFRNVPTCTAAGREHNCSATTADLAALPDYPVFGPDGSMYVTDLLQALIWRIPPGGGRPVVWFTDPGLESLFGPNGIQFKKNGRTLLFALTTMSNPAAIPQRSAGLYELPVRSDGSPGQLRQFWESGMMDGPDGFAIAQSRNVYVALAGPSGNSVAVVSPEGEEIARTPPTEVENQMMEVPFDAPGSAAFLGESVLVTNHAFVTRNPDHWAVLDVFADEPGLALFRP
jgi:sugar lactone lactonase YvrE